MGSCFYDYELDNKKVCFHASNIIEVQIRKYNRPYKTVSTFKAKDFGRAVFFYNCYNVHSGYRKRLICHSLNKPVLARYLSR